MARHTRAKRGIPSENDGMHPSAGFCKFPKEWHRRYPAENFVKICFFSPQNNGFDSKRITTKILLRIFQISSGNIFISEQARRLGNRSFSKLKISQKPGIEDLSSLEFVENTNKDAFATALVRTLNCKYIKYLFH